MFRFIFPVLKFVSIKKDRVSVLNHVLLEQKSFGFIELLRRSRYISYKKKECCKTNIYYGVFILSCFWNRHPSPTDSIINAFRNV